MTTPEPSGLRALRLSVDNQVRTLRQDLDKLGGELASTRLELDDYGSAVGQLAGDVQKLVGQTTALTPFHWPDLRRDDPEKARARWAELVDWVEAVLGPLPWAEPDVVGPKPRRRQAAFALKPCWQQHPEVEDLLTASWLSWLATYRNTNASPWDAPRWERELPAMVEMIARAMTSCDPRRCVLNR